MMRLSLTLIGCLVVLCSGGYVAAKHFWRGETKSLSQVKAKWGDAPFQSEAFKAGGEEVRAKMAFNLLKNSKKFIGKDRAEIRETLGDFDGFYFSDMFPTYIIETAKKNGDSTWQIVFLLDRNEKVSEIIVHKNCCN